MNMLLMAVNGGEGSPMKANLLIDSGIYKTLLMEEQWERLWLEGMNRMPKLEESGIRLISYGTDRSLELLGKARCLIKAEVGAEMITSVYMIKGAQESLLGLRDAQTLGILRIKLDGNMARTRADPW